MATLHIQPVQSLDAPDLALYRTLRRIEEHERAGVLVATNAKVLQRLLASRYTVVSALLTPAWLEKLEPQLRARPEEVRIYVAEQAVLETITGYKLHQGALAVAKIPPQPDFETLLKIPRDRCCSPPRKALPARKISARWCGAARRSVRIS